jgi:hypothetical protein
VLVCERLDVCVRVVRVVRVCVCMCVRARGCVCVRVVLVTSLVGNVHETDT